jgi:hypothetical protein
MDAKAVDNAEVGELLLNSQFRMAVLLLDSYGRAD